MMLVISLNKPMGIMMWADGATSESGSQAVKDKDDKEISKPLIESQ